MRCSRAAARFSASTRACATPFTTCRPRASISAGRARLSQGAAASHSALLTAARHSSANRASIVGSSSRAIMRNSWAWASSGAACRRSRRSHSAQPMAATSSRLSTTFQTVASSPTWPPVSSRLAGTTRHWISRAWSIQLRFQFIWRSRYCTPHSTSSVISSGLSPAAAGAPVARSTTQLSIMPTRKLAGFSRWCRPATRPTTVAISASMAASQPRSTAAHSGPARDWAWAAAG
jgi:hypothetical protein